MTEFHSARDVSEYLLELTGEAIIAGNLDRFLNCLHLPQAMDTPQGLYQLETADDVRTVFENMQRNLQARGVDQIVRHCVEAEFRDPDTVAATHETRLLSRDYQLIEEPFPAFSILRRINGAWKIANMQYASERYPIVPIATATSLV